MTRSKLSSKSLAKAVLKLIPFIFFLSACTSSTTPSFLKEDISKAVKDICKKEYGLDIVTNLTGRTFWVYMPLENIVVKSPEPEKYVERFLVEDRKNQFDERVLRINYMVKPVPEIERQQEMTLDKSVNKKIFNVLQVIRRVLFSTDNKQDKNNPMFFCIVTADIANGFELRQVFHCLDLKKISYGFISQTEYQHRIVQNTQISGQIIGDRDGKHMVYYDIPLEEFLAGQIQGRIRMKFQKPEVDKNVDIDREVAKVVSLTLNTYAFKDFSIVEMSNLASGAKMILNQTAVLSGPKE
ncbi:MAG: hypothetical protein PHW98_02880 [Candidatus Omnitrophica bacterium]|nr:hypothetical protein [Candidatus Omnitrophota bacterium]MDD5770744.1 hypothetical protein [Candidatus Omnitrophota bacterium]